MKDKVRRNAILQLTGIFTVMGVLLWAAVQVGL
jgi:hypothetical protein